MTYETYLNDTPIVYTEDCIKYRGVIIPFSKMQNLSMSLDGSPSWSFSFNGKTIEMPFVESERGKIEPIIQNAIIESLPHRLKDDGRKRKPCPKCGRFVLEKTKICPHCKGKVRPPIYKKWWVWLIVAAVFSLAFFFFVAYSYTHITESGDTELTSPESREEIQQEKELDEASTIQADDVDAMMEETDAETEKKIEAAHDKAVGYLAESGVSRIGLKSLLMKDGLSDDEAERTVVRMEVNGELNWIDECADKARIYMQEKDYDKETLRGKLRDDDFAEEEIDLILDNVIAEYRGNN